MIRVCDVDPSLAVVLFCAPCDRQARLQPLEVSHLPDPEAPVMSLTYVCGRCRRRARPLRIERAGRAIELSEAVPDVAAFRDLRHFTKKGVR